jgi:hypothetical protein
MQPLTVALESVLMVTIKRGLWRGLVVLKFCILSALVWFVRLAPALLSLGALMLV